MIKNSWFSKYFNVDERGEHQGLFDSSGGDCDLKKNECGESGLCYWIELFKKKYKFLKENFININIFRL